MHGKRRAAGGEFRAGWPHDGIGVGADGVAVRGRGARGVWAVNRSCVQDNGAVRYGILGTAQAHRSDGTPVAIGGPRLRTLLTALALRPEIGRAHV